MIYYISIKEITGFYRTHYKLLKSINGIIAIKAKLGKRLALLK